jgi:outer membrane protein assembly factor BamB/Ca2+-binding EF-hand superfamily protein
MRRVIECSLAVVPLALLTGLPLLAETPVGWRNDGRGQYPATSPPTRWASDKNVLWKVALPGSSYGAPIIQGDRLWVVSDPAELVCVHPSDGKVLWQKSIGDVKAGPRRQGRGGSLAGPLLQALDADDDGMLSKEELLAGAERLVKEFDKEKTGSVDEKALTEGIGHLLPAGPGMGRPDGRPGGRRRGPGMGGGGAAGLAAALLKYADSNGDGKLTTEELSAAARKVFQEADKEKKGKLDEQAVAAVISARLPTPGGGRFGRDFGGAPGGRGGRGTGNTAATPVSDGKHVAAVFGNGVAAVYTLEGTRLWARFLESSGLGFGHASSPLLLDGKLIVHIKDLVALDIETGKEAWRVSLPAAHASPVGTRLGGQDVIISPSGAIVRARDGKVLARANRLTSQSSPIVDGDTIYLFGPTIEALRLEQKGAGEVSVTRLWSKEGARERHHLPSPVVYGGLLYGVTTGGFLEVLEARSGERVYRQRLGLSQVYSSVTRAGELLYAVDTRGKAVVFKPGRRFEQVAVNQLEGMGSCPVFDGNRLYLRGQQNLYCLGSK